MSRKNTSSGRPKSRKKSFFVPRYIPVQEVLRLYDLPRSLVAAGYLADAFVTREQETRPAYEAWKGTLGVGRDDNVCKTLITAKESDFSELQKRTLTMICKETPEVFLLKLAILISQASSFRSLSEESLDGWMKQAKSVLAFRGTSYFTGKYKKAYGEMHSYLRASSIYIASLAKNSLDLR